MKYVTSELAAPATRKKHRLEEQLLVLRQQQMTIRNLQINTANCNCFSALIASCGIKSDCTRKHRTTLVNSARTRIFKHIKTFSLVCCGVLARACASGPCARNSLPHLQIEQVLYIVQYSMKVHKLTNVQAFTHVFCYFRRT